MIIGKILSIVVNFVAEWRLMVYLIFFYFFFLVGLFKAGAVNRDRNIRNCWRSTITSPGNSTLQDIVAAAHQGLSSHAQATSHVGHQIFPSHTEVNKPDL